MPEEQRPDETDEEFWKRVDPHDDRLAKTIPLWGCVSIVVVLIAAIVGAGMVGHHLLHMASNHIH